MKLDKSLEEHVAVFGESGSGKTVLLSSFYGATQQPRFWESNFVEVTALDVGQGHQLLKNYNGMRDRAVEPAPDRYRSTTYKFGVKLKKDKAAEAGAKPFDALRLVWHDYPGEWFERSTTGEEAERRAETFRALLSSDVALLLVDAQRLLDHAGEEERYLRTLLGGFRNALSLVEDELLEDGEPLVQFPRIWILALSKADLMPELDVIGFRDLLIDKALDDMNELRRVLRGLVESPDALDLGEDFVLLSSAKFEPDRIEVTERVGVDLMLPLAAMLPLERHVAWRDQKKAVGAVADELVEGLGPLAAAVLGAAGKFLKNKKFKGAGALAALLALGGGKAIAAAAGLAGEKLKAKNAEALAQQDYMAAVLTGYRMDLEQAEKDRILLLSKQ